MEKEPPNCSSPMPSSDAQGGRYCMMKYSNMLIVFMHRRCSTCFQSYFTGHIALASLGKTFRRPRPDREQNYCSETRLTPKGSKQLRHKAGHPGIAWYIRHFRFIQQDDLSTMSGSLFGWRKSTQALLLSQYSPFSQRRGSPPW